ncbi:hypothetical protein ACFL4W_05575 [Planctomycetota bacterium]
MLRKQIDLLEPVPRVITIRGPGGALERREREQTKETMSPIMSKLPCFSVNAEFDMLNAKFDMKTAQPFFFHE